MNENQIVLSLLNFYKSEGLDLHFILDDPIFNSLSLQTKIDMIKKYAGDIQRGMTPGFTPAERRSILREALGQGVMGAITGIGATSAAAKLFSGGRIAPHAIAAGALTGALSGAAVGAVRRMQSQNQKKQLRQYLQNVAENPTDEGAISVIAKRSLQTRSANPDLQNKIIGKIGDMFSPQGAATRVTLIHNELAGRPRIDLQRQN